jgi:hypothetical protein
MNSLLLRIARLALWRKGILAMTEPRIDSLARWLAGAGTRRTVLRAAIRAGGALAANRWQVLQVAAEAPPPIPKASLEGWPVCSESRRFYCVESLAVDGVDQLAMQEPEFVPWVTGDRGAVDGGVTADRLQWGARRANNDLETEDLSREIHLRFRSGLLEPVAGFLRAADVEMAVDGDASTGWRVDVRGRPAVVPGFLGPVPTQQADVIYVWFSGMAEHRTSRALSGWGGYEGSVAAAGIHGYSAPNWRGSGWNVFLQSAHLLPGGEINHGSYRAWISAASLRRLELTASQAASGDLVITRIDNGVEAPVAASLSVVKSGVLVDIPDLTFSSPTIVMQRRGKGGCAKKCRKGRFCKNGRCVKKKKRRKH